MENELMHYGIPGMKWGKRSVRYNNKVEKLDRKNIKLEKKIDTGLKRAEKVRRKNRVKVVRLQNKMRVAKMTFNKNKVAELNSKIMNIEAETMMARYKVTQIEDKIRKNKKTQQKLKTKIDDALRKEAEEVRKALLNKEV